MLLDGASRGREPARTRASTRVSPTRGNRTARPGVTPPGTAHLCPRRRRPRWRERVTWPHGLGRCAGLAAGPGGRLQGRWWLPQGRRERRGARPASRVPGGTAADPATRGSPLACDVGAGHAGPTLSPPEARCRGGSRGHRGPLSLGLEGGQENEAHRLRYCTSRQFVLISDTHLLELLKMNCTSYRNRTFRELHSSFGN